MGEKRNSYRILVGKPEGKRPLGRPRRRWGDSTKMDLREIHLLTVFSSRFTCPEDGGDTFVRNVGSNHNYTAPDPRRRLSSSLEYFY
jgi:hypothetical protein